MEGSKKASMIVGIDSLLVSFGMACALVIFSAPTAMISLIVEDNVENLKEKSNFEQEKDYTKTILQIVGGLLVIFFLFNILLILMLYNGTRHRSISKLNGWFITNCVLTALIIFETMVVGGFWDVSAIIAKIPNCIFIIYRIITIHIIRKFINEIKFYNMGDNVKPIKYTSPPNIETLEE